MSTPVVENIAAFLESAVNEITTDNGFNYTLSAIRTKRFFLEDETFNDLEVYILQGKTDLTGKVLGKTAPRTTKQEYLLWAVCLQSDTSEDAIDTKINKVKADIHKKLCEDLTCSGYAKFLDITSVEPTDVPETGILITIEVTYSTQWADPYEGT